MKNLFKTKKKRTIIMITIILLFLLFNLFTELAFYGNRLDFFWNYSFGLQITKGILPYSGYNMVPTPLLAFSTALFLKVFGTGIVSYSVYMAILKTLLTSLVSLLAAKLINNNSKYDKYYVFIISFALLNFLLCNYYFEYNFFADIFLLLIILLEINNYRNKNDTIQYNILIGFLAGLSILSKHSVGLFISLFVVIKPLLFNKDKKIKNMLFRIIGILIPSIIFLLYLLLTNSFDDFMSYSVLGIKEFKNSFPFYIFLSEIILIDRLSYRIYLIIYIVIFLTLLIYIIHRFYMIIKTKNKNYNYIDSLVFFYSLSSFSCMYPIRDITHLNPAMLPLSALIIVSIYNKIKLYYKKIPKKFNTIFICWISIILLVVSIYPIYKYFGIKYEFDNASGYNDHYLVTLNDDYGVLENLALDYNIKKALDAVLEYEKENDCLILDSNATLFHLASNKYYKNYDLFMRGNLGADGEDKIINDLESKNNVKLLISYDIRSQMRDKYKQIPRTVFDYIFENFEITDRVAFYDVYERKDK
jgi:hypothetical protein